MNVLTNIEDLSEDIDPAWAGDGSHLPKWFVSALKVPREEGYVEIDGARAHYFRWGDRRKPKLLMTPLLCLHSAVSCGGLRCRSVRSCWNGRQRDAWGG